MTFMLNDIITAKTLAVTHLEKLLSGRCKHGIEILQISDTQEIPETIELSLGMPIQRPDNISVSFDGFMVIDKQKLFYLLNNWSDEWYIDDYKNDKLDPFVLESPQNLFDLSHYEKCDNGDYDLFLRCNVLDIYEFAFCLVLNPPPPPKKINADDEGDVRVPPKKVRKDTEGDVHTQDVSTEQVKTTTLDSSWKCHYQLWSYIDYKNIPKTHSIFAIENSIHKILELVECTGPPFVARVENVHTIDDLLNKYIKVADLRRVISCYHNLDIFRNDADVLL